MAKSLNGELQARRLELEKAMAELSALRERVAIAEHVVLDSQFVLRALSPPHQWGAGSGARRSTLPTLLGTSAAST